MFGTKWQWVGIGMEELRPLLGLFASRNAISVLPS